MILQISPQAPMLVHVAAGALLALHIGGGMVGLISGTIAMLARKGGRNHRTAGNVFFVSMLIVSAIGAGVSPWLPDWANVAMGVFTFYLVVTGWAAAKRKPGAIGVFDVGALLASAGVATLLIIFSRLPPSQTAFAVHLPPPVVVMFLTLWSFAAALDLSVLLRGGLTGGARIGRHLWRMSTALLIAAVSFFVGQAHLFPAPWRELHLLVLPEVTVLALLIFWMVRVSFTDAYNRKAPAARAQTA